MLDEDFVEQKTAEQPTRSGKKRSPRRFDKTQLHAKQHGRQVHRDYAAHFFRWGWVARHLKRFDRVLDVGCGQDIPLLWVLSGAQSVLPSYYLGIDLNVVDDTGKPKWATILDQFSFADEYETMTTPEHPMEKFDAIVNFEVIEHMMPVDGRRMLEGFKYWLKPDGHVYLSTPVFNGKAAVNHVHEYEIPELRSLIESVGFVVEARFGTFASANDIRAGAELEDLAVWDKLYDFYGGDVLSTFLAPLYPDLSRNNLWVLRLPTIEE